MFGKKYLIVEQQSELRRLAGFATQIAITTSRGKDGVGTDRSRSYFSVASAH